MKAITIISFILFSYLCGSLPIGVILGKLKGKDPREVGSKNIGATNVMRAAGKFMGILTLIGDMAKGAVPVILACLFFDNPYIIAISALAVFIGHIFPIFLKFKGGKGVATAVGVYLVISPLSVVMAIFLFIAIVYKWRYISLASISCAAAMPVFIGFLSSKKLYILLAIIMGAIIILRHKDNIKRLINHKENKFTI